MKTIGVIPARYNSSRMPGKPIEDINGKPMIWWVYQEALKCEEISEIVVATDDKRIEAVCIENDIKVMMTSDNHDTPTSRLCEVAQRTDGDMYLMIMGDEPLVNHECFSLIIPKELKTNFYVAALTNVLERPTDVIDFSNQKVVVNENRETLLISRSPIPYPKGTLDFEYEKVTGVQIFSREALEFYDRTPKSSLEKAEENDLMRFVEHGHTVIMNRSSYKTISVDTPKDLELVRKIIGERENH